MQCENHLCVFWKKDKCILNKISLGIFGQCAECIYIDISPKVIEKQRQQMLKSYREYLTGVNTNSLNANN